jgi:uncharacterized cupredoxin-like copper-binding protein
MSLFFLVKHGLNNTNHFWSLADSKRTIGLNDGEMKTLTSTMTAIGQWGLICHVGNHLSMGMLDNYIVYPPENCPLPKLASLD